MSTTIENTNEALPQEPVQEPISEAAAPVAETPEVVENEMPQPETPAEPAAEEPAAEVPAAEEPAATEPAAAEATGEMPAPEIAPDEETSEKEQYPFFETTAEVLNRIKELTEAEGEISRGEMEALKSNFYRLYRQQAEEHHKKFIDEGGNPEDYQPLPPTEELEFKELMAKLRERRAQQHELEAQALEENYNKKVAIIDRINELLNTPDDINKFYGEFKNLQQQWNDIKAVPAEKATELWKNYQHAVEQFYDTLKLNNEFRAYDFKKNLELKTALCERAEKLAEEPDVLTAFRRLQQLHQEFREIGPVEREKRAEIWNRFKDASTVINRRHQEYFEQRKQREQENLQAKTEICEEVEGFNLDGLKTFADWNAISDKIIALQAKWKSLGFAPQKQNVKIFERFRAACDNFFSRKSEYFKTVRESLNNNLKLKEELVAKAEELKESTAWKETTEAIQALQKRWREIGTVPKKFSDDVWKRFNAACDAFFEAKKEANGTQYAEQKENLAKKQAIVDQLAAIDPETAEGDIRPQLRKAQEDWNAVGHVPYRDKETIYKAFRAQMDRLYGALGESATQRRIEQFKNSVKDADGKIRERLLRQRDILTNEIKTYENNLGFLNLTSKSKNGSKLLDELNRKVEKLKADLNELKQKISALDEKE